ncbi:MAG TPA: ABC transporter ATP-binding protein [Candidatus Eisenbacteria bacterium]|nr:ABC transporter ATP-binding protein [Candidatus Eisenbacteria bacterium]
MAETARGPGSVERTGGPALQDVLQDVPAVRMERAAVRLGGRTIWRDVDLSVRPGEFVAVLGPNGSGKSTLLRAVLGVQPLSEGSVSVLGRRVRHGNDAIGYLPQRHWFDPDLRVRGVDLVRLGLDGNRWGVPLRRRGDRRRRVDQALDLVGAREYARRSIGELSGGEQQRLLIAQALVTGARVLLLDEPLESLDLNNQQAISGLVRRVCREQGVTVLLVAHDVNPILPYLDQVVYVARGRALAGSPEDVIRTDTLSALYRAPIEVLRTGDGRLLVVGQHETVSFHGRQA